MRSYIMSLTFVACLIGAYTAVVMTSKKPDSMKPQAAPQVAPNFSAEADSREPASAN